MDLTELYCSIDDFWKFFKDEWNRHQQFPVIYFFTKVIHSISNTIILMHDKTYHYEK